MRILVAAVVVVVEAFDTQLKPSNRQQSRRGGEWSRTRDCCCRRQAGRGSSSWGPRCSSSSHRRCRRFAVGES